MYYIFCTKTDFDENWETQLTVIKGNRDKVPSG